ncbi:UNVERIFIED_CONTAM: LIM domain-binding protein 2 [Trichonephila clavipes]
MKPMLNSGIGFPGPQNDPFYASPFSNYFRRHTPYFGQPDYRIYEMNKRLQQRTEESDNLWWDAFATEFFEDDATLTLTFCLEDGPKRYTIGRTLIPRYFRSIFEGEVTDLYFSLKHPKESFHNTTITLDCDQCTMVAHHGKPMYNKCIKNPVWFSPVSPELMLFILGGQYPNELMKEQLAKDNAVVVHVLFYMLYFLIYDAFYGQFLREHEAGIKVCTEGRLILEFTFDDLMRIKSWHFATRQHRELVPRSLIALQAQQQDPAILEQLSKNITRQGLTNSTLNYLRCETKLPSATHRAGPNDFKMQPEVETQRPPSKRRKRKSSATNNANSTGTGSGKKKNMSPGPPNFSLASQNSSSQP